MENAMNENEQLNQILESPAAASSDGNKLRSNVPQEVVGNGRAAMSDYRQWQIGPNDSFRPAGLTTPSLVSGVYKFSNDSDGVFISRMAIVTDNLTELPDTASERVLAGMRHFWGQRDRYSRHGLIYKRGVLLWGPPGSGKTATLSLLSRQLIADGGVVIISDHPGLTSYGIQMLRRIEPQRRLIVVIEDIDETIARYSEHELLALLDGENQVDNVVMIATTNYPERLGARIVNRPSRFDERILVGMPSPAARKVYLKSVAGRVLTRETLDTWVSDTEGLSIAHLRELTAAVMCLDQPYQEVLDRLKLMRQRPREHSGFGDGKTGF